MCLSPYSCAYCCSTARYLISPYDSKQTQQQQQKSPALLIQKSCCHRLGWQTNSVFIGKKGQQTLFLTGRPEWDLPSSNSGTGQGRRSGPGARSCWWQRLAAASTREPRAVGLSPAESAPGAMLGRAARSRQACPSHGRLRAKHGSSFETGAMGACLKDCSTVDRRRPKFTDVTPLIDDQSKQSYAN